MTTDQHVKASEAAAKIVSEYPEITEPWRQSRLRAEIQYALEQGMSAIEMANLSSEDKTMNEYRVVQSVSPKLGPLSIVRVRMEDGKPNPNYSITGSPSADSPEELRGILEEMLQAICKPYLDPQDVFLQDGCVRDESNLPDTPPGGTQG